MIKILIALLLFWPSTSLAARGCCSWHGGQSYCGSSGYWICGDGTESPSCTCNYQPPAETPKIRLFNDDSAGRVGTIPIVDNECPNEVTQLKIQIEDLQKQLKTEQEKKWWTKFWEWAKSIF